MSDDKQKDDKKPVTPPEAAPVMRPIAATEPPSELEPSAAPAPAAAPVPAPKPVAPAEAGAQPKRKRQAPVGVSVYVRTEVVSDGNGGKKLVRMADEKQTNPCAGKLLEH